MPYQSIAAQHLYCHAYNAAWTRCADLADWKSFCHRETRLEVRRNYKKDMEWRLATAPGR